MLSNVNKIKLVNKVPIIHDGCRALAGGREWRG